jgi:cytochrome c biogenesis protein CcmG/thiol:disulfide interchange protein DsbE
MTGMGRGSRISAKCSVGALLVLSIFTASFCQPVRADEQSLAALLKHLHLVAYRAGTAPPPFDGTTAADKAIALAALRGHVVIVNFWATWCAECRPEMPALERLHRDYASRGLAMIGVNARENVPTIRRFVKELDLTFPMVVDLEGRINTLYGVVGVPATFIIGRDGRAVAFGVGPREWASAPARSLVEELLKEPRPHAL